MLVYIGVSIYRCMYIGVTKEQSQNQSDLCDAKVFRSSEARSVGRRNYEVIAR